VRSRYWSGWAAVTDSLAWTPVVLFAIIFVWTPPHFWALAVKYKDDYQAASVPMLPAVATFKRTARRSSSTACCWWRCPCCWPVAKLGAIYVVSASVLGVVFVALAVRLWRTGHPEGGHAAVQLLDHLPDAALRTDGGRHLHQALIETSEHAAPGHHPTGRSGPDLRGAASGPDRQPPPGSGPPGPPIGPAALRALLIGSSSPCPAGRLPLRRPPAELGIGLRIGSRWWRWAVRPPTSPSLPHRGPRGDLDALGKDRHHPVVLNFFASWCMPCQPGDAAAGPYGRRRAGQGLHHPVHRGGRGRPAGRAPSPSCRSRHQTIRWGPTPTAG
jgi:hypothetical protein